MPARYYHEVKHELLFANHNQGNPSQDIYGMGILEKNCTSRDHTYNIQQLMQGLQISPRCTLLAS